MKIHLLLSLFIVVFWNKEVKGEIEYEIKRGAFPFMAVIYYPDESIVDSTGIRFQHAAVLIKPQWLISAAIDHSVLDNIPLGFPRKTLLARLGAITLDANFTLNEDEDEQEREVIQVVRPSKHNTEEWWLTDITLLQTLLPFKQTSAVAITTISSRRDFIDKNCMILVYAKKLGNNSDERVLMQLGVELLPPLADNCGSFFNPSTMTCAVQSEESKSVNYDPEFCQGNAGGPLLCEGEVTGLQTYIENNCKQQPHLFQLLGSWNNFITCATEKKCNPNDLVCNICSAVNKDSLAIEIAPSTGLPPTKVVTANVSSSNRNAITPQETSSLRSLETHTTETDTKATDYTTKELITENTFDTTTETRTESTETNTTPTETSTETLETTTKEEASSEESTSEEASAIRTETSITTTAEAGIGQKKKLYWPHYKSSSSSEEEETARDVKVEVEAQQRAAVKAELKKLTSEQKSKSSADHSKSLTFNYFFIILPIVAHFI